MYFGYCTGFSTNPHFGLGRELFNMIHKTGFNGVEFPLMNFHNMTDKDFSELENEVRQYSFSCPTACNFFPGSVRLVGKEADAAVISSYLDIVLPRCNRLGIKTIILGSGPARTYGSDQTAEEAYNQFVSLIKDVILPKTKQFGMVVCIEPFEKTYCNLIVSALEGLKLVKDINDSSFMLMIDIYHMLSNGEDLKCLEECYPYIKHVHVAGPERRVPENSDEYVFKALKILSDLGYKGSISFETEMPKTQAFLADCLDKVKLIF